MANRVIRDWTASEKIDRLTANAEVFFTRLIMKADDHGCFHANPKLLKAALFPLRELTDKQIIAWLQECSETGMLITYQSEGKHYLKILDFGQRLRTMVSKFPQPADNSRTNDRNPRTTVSNARPELETEVETEVKVKADRYTNKQEAFEDLKQNDLYVDEVHRVLTGRNWNTADKIDVIALLSYFMNGKADIDNTRKDVRKHFKNWIIRESLANLQTYAEVFKRSITNGIGTAQRQSA